MRKFFRFVKWVLMALLGFVTILFVFVFLRKDRTFDAPYPAIHASTDSLVIERGKELVYGAAHCVDCHSAPELKATRSDSELTPLTGGFVFDIPPATIRTPNITNDPETGIGNWPDSVVARSLRYGVSHDGRALIEFMPFQNISNADLTAIISYLRYAPPVRNEVKKSEWKMLGNVLRAFVIEPVGPSGDIPDVVEKDSGAAYGKYLAESVANCRGCHTNRDLKTGKYIGPYYAGGFEMPSVVNPDFMLVTPNITSDPETGKLAHWSESDFIQRFRRGKLIHESIMPWTPFQRLSDMELKAIYRFLMSVSPVKNKTGPVLVKVTK